MSPEERLRAHLAEGQTTVARAWLIRRRDGWERGFTDHDRDLSFEGVVFHAASGLSAGALEQGAGLAVDNALALGALSDAAVEAADIEAGRFDGAEVTAWLVNWADPQARAVIFRGEIGEIRRRGHAFEAELRGLSERLNEPRGRLYQRRCSAVLGDARCGVALDAPGMSAEAAADSVREKGRVLVFADGLPGFAPGWFTRGRVTVLDGPLAGLVRIVKAERRREGAREIELWEPLGGALAAGVRVRLEPGCDKRAETCRLKFHNIINFRGFPHLPGEDWLVARPVAGDGA